MIPKEKAEELFQFYLPFVSGLGNIDDIKYRCKQCALICVNEILNQSWDAITTKYWENVKKEIENLN